jgi:hypothetical protein
MNPLLLAALAGAAVALSGCSSGDGSSTPGDTTAPTVASVWPTDGATAVPTGVTISVVFSEPVDQATLGAANVVLRGAGGAPVSVSVIPSGSAVTLVPASPLGWLTTYTVEVGTGVRDLAGNRLASPFTSTFTTEPEPDLASPTVVTFAPAANATGVAADVQVTVTFSEAVREDSAAAAISLAGPGGAVPCEVTTQGATSTLRPLAPLAELTTYTVTVTTAVRDLAGNPLGAGVAWSFTTRDLTPPSVLSVSPADGARGQELLVVVNVVFSEQIDPATVGAATFQLRDPGGAPLAGTIHLGGNAAGLVPSAPLAPGTTYTVSLGGGIADLAGNPLPSPFTSTFTTTGAGTGSWTPMAAPAPLEPYAARAGPSAVWTGSEMVVWGGYYSGPQGQIYVHASGGRYLPASDTWQAIPSNLPGTPAGRLGHATVWTGSRMIVWGGVAVGGVTATGGVFDPAAPASSAWKATATAGAPEARRNPVAAWTGSEMIVWGGSSENGQPYFGTGGRYDPASDTWAAVSEVGAPTPRLYPAAVWTGSRLLVWGGIDANGVLGDGASYDPDTDTWEPLGAGGPSARWKASAVWTGSEMIVWGGSGFFIGPFDDGAAYDPAAKSWSALSSAGAPPPHEAASTVWTGTRMILWGGNRDFSARTQTGGLYDPVADAWSLTALLGAPSAREDPAAVWTGSELLVWGGIGSAFLEDGARYAP